MITRLGDEVERDRLDRDRALGLLRDDLTRMVEPMRQDLAADRQLLATIAQTLERHNREAEARSERHATSTKAKWAAATAIGVAALGGLQQLIQGFVNAAGG